MISLTTIIELNILLVLFYLCYFFILRNEKSFIINRYYLLITLGLTFIIPFLDVYFLSNNPANVQRYLPDVTLLNQPPVVNVVEESINWEMIIWYTYLIAAFGFLLRTIVTYIKIMFLLRKYSFEKKNDVNIVVQTDFSTFSFFNYILLNKDNIGNEKIMNHELVHATQKHSFDIVFIELAKIILWFNPFVYLYKKALVENHEFIADEQVTLDSNPSSYMQSIIHQALDVSPQLTHSFINPKILKRRIIMIKKEKMIARIIAKSAFAVCLASGIGFLFSCSSDNGGIKKNVDTVKVGMASDSTIILIDKNGDSNIIDVTNILDSSDLLISIESTDSSIVYIDDKGDTTKVNIERIMIADEIIPPTTRNKYQQGNNKIGIIQYNKSALEAMTEDNNIISVKTKGGNVLFEDKRGKDLNYITNNIVPFEELKTKLRTGEIIILTKKKELKE